MVAHPPVESTIEDQVPASGVVIPRSARKRYQVSLATVILGVSIVGCLLGLAIFLSPPQQPHDVKTLVRQKLVGHPIEDHPEILLLCSEHEARPGIFFGGFLLDGNTADFTRVRTRAGMPSEVSSRTVDGDELYVFYDKDGFPPDAQEGDSRTYYTIFVREKVIRALLVGYNTLMH